MDSTTRAWTFTGIKKVAFFLIFFFQTNLTRVTLCILVFWWVKLHHLATQFTFSRRLRLDSTIVWDLTDIVLNSAQFDGLTRHKLVAFLFSIDIFDFSDNEVGFFWSWDVALDWRVGFDSVRFELFFGQLVFVNKVNFDFGRVWFYFVQDLEFRQQLVFFIIEGVLLILSCDDLLGWVIRNEYIIFSCKWWQFWWRGGTQTVRVEFCWIKNQRVNVNLCTK